MGWSVWKLTCKESSDLELVRIRAYGNPRCSQLAHCHLPGLNGTLSQMGYGLLWLPFHTAPKKVDSKTDKAVCRSSGRYGYMCRVRDPTNTSVFRAFQDMPIQSEFAFGDYVDV